MRIVFGRIVMRPFGEYDTCMKWLDYDAIDVYALSKLYTQEENYAHQYRN